MSHTAEKNHAAEAKAEADAKAAAAAKEKAALVARPDLLLVAMATDYLIGDKHNYARIRQQAINVLKGMGEDGKEALARIEGMTGRVPIDPVPHGPVVHPVTEPVHEAKTPGRHA